jgi:integrase
LSTDRQIKSALPGRYTVAGVKGLMLDVTPKGSRSWFLRIQRGGKRHDIGLGPYPEVTLAAARDKALARRRAILEGQAPLANQHAPRALTFKLAAEALIESKGPGWRNAKHRAQWTSTLTTYAYPKLGERDVKGIEVGDILEVLRPIWTEKTETASRVRQRIEAVLDYAGAMKARSGEVRGMPWAEIDDVGDVWTVPAGRIKAGKEPRVPLTAAAKALLGERGKPEALVFPAPSDAEKPLSDMTLTAVLKRMERADLTAHGFCSTFRDWAGESTAHPREVIEAALTHQLKDKAEAAYARGDLFVKRRKLMEDWAEFLSGTPSPAAAASARRRRESRTPS